MIDEFYILKMKVHNFIENYYTNLEKVCKVYPYISFGLICAGIEFLGKCLDNKHEFNDDSVASRHNVEKALKKLMRPYYSYKEVIYEDVRCGLLHSLLPMDKVWIVEKDKTKYTHLSKEKIHGTDRLVIVLESFYQDFKKACEETITIITTNKHYTHQKYKRDFIETEE